MLEKGAIRKVQPSKGEFVSNLFLVKKKDGGQRPVINLKQLNAYIPYCHFKMEGLQNLKYMLQKGDYMCKLDLKDAYFSVPLYKDSRQLVCFCWSGNVYEFRCLCFGLGPASQIFTKLLKVLMTILSKIAEHQNNDLLRRHAIDWSLLRRDNHELKHSNLRSATSRICHKLEKVCVDTSAGNRVFGPDNQLYHRETFFKQNKNPESSFRMSEFVKESSNIISGIDKTDWLVDVNYSSSFNSKAEL